MWPTLLTLWLALSGQAPRRPAPRRRPVSRHPSARPRLEALEDRCCPSSGALDPTFGSGGIVTTALTQKNTQSDISPTGVLLQPNGDLIAYGYFSGFFSGNKAGSGGGVLARYTPSGSLDTSFGNKGFVLTPAMVSRAALQSNGQIVTLGADGAVRRYNSNGSLDTTFGSNGVVQGPITTWSDDAGLLIQPSNGDIVIGGLVLGGKTTPDSFALARYTPNGTLDSTFGNGGEVVTRFASDASVNSLALENGDIVAGGWTQSGWLLARYTPSGSLDTTFGSAGFVTISWPPNPGPKGTYMGYNITSLLVQPNGQIVTVGTGTGSNGYPTWALARYNSDGSLDSTFGSGGIVTSTPTGNGAANGAALQSNGQIVVVGGQAVGGVGAHYVQASLFEVGVYNANGSLDTSFGSGGFVIQTTTYGATAAGVVIQPDGKIVVAGSVAMGGAQFGLVPEDFRLARYGPSAAQIGSFTASPNPVTAGSNVTLTASNIILADPNSSITQVAFYLDSNGDGILEPGTDTLLGYGTPSNGTWTLTFSTTNWAAAVDTLFTQAKDNYGVFSDPLALTLQVL